MDADKILAWIICNCCKNQLKCSQKDINDFKNKIFLCDNCIRHSSEGKTLTGIFSPKPESFLKIVPQHCDQKVILEKTLVELSNKIETLTKKIDALLLQRCEPTYVVKSSEESDESDDEEVKEPMLLSRFTVKKEEEELSSESEEEGSDTDESESDESAYWDSFDSDDTDDEN